MSLTIRPVNDPPVLPPLPDQTNSPETLETFIPLPTHDVDGDLLVYTVTVANPAVAEAREDGTGTLILIPRSRGVTDVSVRATDGLLVASATFTFTVTEVTKLRRWTIPNPGTRSDHHLQHCAPRHRF